MRLLSLGLLSLLMLSGIESLRAEVATHCRPARGVARSAVRHGRQLRTGPAPIMAAPVCVVPAAPAPAVVAPSTLPTPTSDPAPQATVDAAADAELAADLQEDLERLQGTWQRTENLRNGGQTKSQKIIEGHHETLKFFGPDGTLLREQQAELKLERAGDLRVIRWSQAVVTAGRDTGSKIDDGTIVYTFKDGKWISVIGLIQHERWGVYTEAWDREFAGEKGK